MGGDNEETAALREERVAHTFSVLEIAHVDIVIAIRLIVQARYSGEDTGNE